MANLSAILSGITRLRTGTTQVSRDYPVLAATVTVTEGAGAWTLGAYTQVVAASVVPASILLGINVQLRQGAPVDAVFEIATGGAGAEVVVARVRGQQFYDSTVGMQVGQWLPTPPVQIPANARLSIRCAGITGSQGFACALLTVPTPL